MAKSLTKTEKLMTTKEVAQALGISVRTVQRVAKTCLPAKQIEHGKATLYTEEELTLMLDCLKKSNDNQYHTTTGAVAVATTDLTPALMIKQAMELAQKGYELELQRIEAEKARVEKERDTLQIELDQSKEWASVKRMQALNNCAFDWRALRDYSKKHRYEIKKVFDQNYGEVNAYHKDVWEAVYGEQIEVWED